jgi:hypothetical protein
MKRILLIASLTILSLQAYSQATQGTRVAAPIVPNDSSDVYPSHDAAFGKDGFRSVGTIAERDAIKAGYRKEGMLVWVKADGVIYQLIGGTANTNWVNYNASQIGIKSPVISISVTDSVYDYQMAPNSYSYTVPLTYTIKRPYGCASISAVKLNGVSISVPNIAEGSTYVGTSSILFKGPLNPGSVDFYSESFAFKVAALKDTVVDSLKLNMYWMAYIGGELNFFTGVDGVLKVYGDQFPTYGRQILLNGSASTFNFSPGNKNLVIGVPSSFASKSVYINGLPSTLFSVVPTYYTTFSNARGAVRSYVAFVTPHRIIGNIQKIEIK